MSRVDQLMAMEPEFAEALANLEPWAVQHADILNGMDGLPTTRRHPERNLQQNGVTRRNWCGTCASKQGCVTCDLDGHYPDMKGAIGKYED
jgi:hypothetical protein